MTARASSKAVRMCRAIRSTAREYLDVPMVVSMKGLMRTVSITAREYIDGPMVVSIKGLGRTIRCTAEAR